jgi:polysaccharide pyruvyl transferase WcaK-like protein
MTVEGRVSTHVVITNVYPDDNRGGAAITAATIEMARRLSPASAVTMVAVSSDASRLEQDFRFTRRLYPDVEILPGVFDLHRAGPGRRLRHYGRSILLLAAPRLASRHAAERRLTSATLVIGKGGQAFRGFRTRQLGSLWFTTFPLVLARRARRPAMAVGISVGPFSKGRISRVLAGWVLRRLSLVLVRGFQSQRMALDLGVSPSRLRVAPDSVFFLEPPGDAQERRARLGVPADRYLVATLASVPGQLRWKKVQALSAIIRRLLDADVADRAIVVVQTQGTTSDIGISQELVEACHDSRVQLFDQDVNHQDLMALYSGAELVVGSRLHSSLLALVAGTPAFPIAFFDKPFDVFGGLGAEDMVLDFRNKTPDQLADDILRQLSSRPHIRDEITELAHRLRWELDDVLLRVLSDLEVKRIASTT